MVWRLIAIRLINSLTLLQITDFANELPPQPHLQVKVAVERTMNYSRVQLIFKRQIFWGTFRGILQITSK